MPERSGTLALGPTSGHDEEAGKGNLAGRYDVTSEGACQTPPSTVQTLPNLSAAPQLWDDTGYVPQGALNS